MLNVLAVFEAKAGPKAARELSFARASISDLTGAEKTELRAFAKDTFREQRSLAKAAGKPYTKTLEQVEREMVQSERGGQIRRDIERLTKDYKINVGIQTLPITFSPTKTKFFALVPNDLSSRGLATIRAELAAENVTFEVIDAGLSTKQLDDAASSLSSLAANFVNGAVAAPGLPPTAWHPPLPLPE